MKTRTIVLSILAAAALQGCATNQGGTKDDYSTNFGQGESSVPRGTDTFRPGINRDDIRDPNALPRQEPTTNP